ncbi:MAG: phosphate/phosphite/phosphonate ABC transporter substrate-binding protein [Oscillospiraceae bacterium]
MKNSLFKRIVCGVVAGAMALSMAACGASSDSKKPADKITIVWYPNESAADYESARAEFAKLITQATGKEVEHKLTTDYSIAIEAMASGTAQICFMGAQGYVEANKKSAKVQPLFVNSGESGTLDDAIYYSWFAVNKADEETYQKDGAYSIEAVQGKRMSYVSDSSTSGFKVPTNAIITLFSATDKWKSITVDDLIEGGSDKFFSEVLYGGSHQGSAVNLLTGKADVAAFCDTELAAYMDLVSGTEDTAGAVYQVKDNATAPFDSLKGKQCVIIKSTPVLNGPFAYNADTLSADDVKKIQDLFTSDAVTNNPQIFVTEGSGLVGMFEKEGSEKFVLVQDSWYDPIRNMK